MKLTSTINNELDMEIDEKISEYYDDELKISDALFFEANIAISDNLKNHYFETMYLNFKISNSIHLTKIRAKQKAKDCVNVILKSFRYKEKLLIFNLYAVCLQNLNKFFGGRLLDIDGNNS